MPENIEPVVEVRQLHDLNVQTLADDLGKVLSKHVGGTFAVRLTKLEHTNAGFGDDKMLLSFRVNDESSMERYALTKEGLFLATVFSDNS